ncbi:MAG: diguanylate cyclase [Eggerthellaceae bacterium]|nr:diguanylate cyclase [Eggerthellaceae bacterium]
MAHIRKRERYTASEAKLILNHLSKTFSEARLVDPSECRELRFDENDTLILGAPCYDRWSTCNRCDNCIGQQALNTDTKCEKFEFLGDSMYWMASRPVVVTQGNGQDRDCVIEAMTSSLVKDHAGSFGQNPNENKTLLNERGFYVDWLTKLYNRRYFDEGAYLGYLKLNPNIDLGMVVCKLENLEYLVDVYGSAERDLAVRQLGILLERHCRPRDIIIRMDDDKFLLMLPSASEEYVQKTMNRIRAESQSSIVGAAWGPDDVWMSVGNAWVSPFDGTASQAQELYRTAEEFEYLDRRGVRMRWDAQNGDWKFSVPDAINAARSADTSKRSITSMDPDAISHMETATTVADILEESPETAHDPLIAWLRAFATKERSKPSESFLFPMPLVSKAFEPGCAEHAVAHIDDIDIRNLTNVELEYLTCNFAKAGRDADALMEANQNLSVRAAAGLLSAVANVADNHPVFAKQSLDKTEALCKRGLQHGSSSKTKAACAFVDSTLIALFEQERSGISPISETLSALPEGQRLFVSYLMARQSFAQGEYGNSLGVVSTALSYCEEVYPVSLVYLHAIAACDHMALMRTDEAKREFSTAWELAKPDKVFAPFVELYAQLQGLVDVCLKASDPAAYRLIARAAQRFRVGWITTLEGQERGALVSTLTPSEMTVAALALRGWSNRQIATWMGLSENTVKHRASSIYQKLHIGKRSELSRFRLS